MEEKVTQMTCSNQPKRCYYLIMATLTEGGWTSEKVFEIYEMRFLHLLPLSEHYF